MMKNGRITMQTSTTLESLFEDFLMSRKVEGAVEKTITTYKQQFRAVSKHLPNNLTINSLTKKHLENMIESMRRSNLSANSIRSYCITISAFLNWCKREGYTDLTLPRYKAEETIKETYTDEELRLLLKRPNMHNCRFAEYRNWVIINLLVNNGCRSASYLNKNDL